MPRRAPSHLSTGDPHVAAREPRRASDGLPQVGAGVEEVSPCKIVWNQFEPIRTNYFYFYYFFFVGTRRTNIYYSERIFSALVKIKSAYAELADEPQRFDS